eukprot:TRINITY_DN84926_c0_g1_i1.p1 TRINITY_DN84926_c0_g1~~TRINITY_DN84926_c0_g1_i1.p1  ORF type:complete len:266 (+),score=40.60 TRINITY_DN84926_c0_g1_i1:36-833(+)
MLSTPPDGDACACSGEVAEHVAVEIAALSDGDAVKVSMVIQPVDGALKVSLPDDKGFVMLCAPERPVPVLGGVVSGASLAATAFLPHVLQGWSAEQAAPVLELGAGRGLAGLAAARYGCSTCLTDLEALVVAALESSVEKTCASDSEGAFRSRPRVRTLDWDDGLEGIVCDQPGMLILGQELLWADDAVDSLMEAVRPIVVELGATFVYGASKRPSNQVFLDQMQDEPGTHLVQHNALVRRDCAKCKGWRSLEQCTIAIWSACET